MLMSQTAADLIITKASVYTVDADNPWAEAVATKDGQIVFVGSAAEAEQWHDPFSCERASVKEL